MASTHIHELENSCTHMNTHKATNKLEKSICDSDNRQGDKIPIYTKNA